MQAGEGGHLIREGKHPFNTKALPRIGVREQSGRGLSSTQLSTSPVQVSTHQHVRDWTAWTD